MLASTPGVVGTAPSNAMGPLAAQLPAPASATSMPVAATSATSGVPVEVWIPDEKGGIDRLVHATDGVQSTDPVVLEAYATARKVLDYYQREFGRSSFDGDGTVLKLRVHASDPYTGEKSSSNAYWFNDEGRMWLGSGDGQTFKPLGGAKDVVAHEFAHGIVDDEVKLEYIGQQGALHEHIADILAFGVDGNWQIGEDALTDQAPVRHLRDLSNLTHKDWRSFPAWEDEVHAMSEVPSHAAYLVGEKLGAGELRKIWYSAVTDHLKDNAGFAGLRDATIAAAGALHGTDSSQLLAVQEAWDAVGILSDTPKDRFAGSAGFAARSFDLGGVLAGVRALG